MRSGVLVWPYAIADAINGRCGSKRAPASGLIFCNVCSDTVMRHLRGACASRSFAGMEEMRRTASDQRRRLPITK